MHGSDPIPRDRQVADGDSWTPPGAHEPPSTTPPAAPPTTPPAPWTSAPPGPASWQPPAPGGSWGAPPTAGGPGGTPPPPPPEVLPDYAAAPPPRRRRWQPLVAIVGVVALLGSGLFAVSALTAADGSSSPEAAVEGLFDAIDHEDAAGVVESLPPGERAILGDPLLDVVGELQRLDLLADFDVHDVPGVDLDVDGLEVESRPLGDGVAAVQIVGGTITGVAIPDELPVGELLADDWGAEAAGPPPESETTDLADADLELVAIEEDGGWHVSALYTVAEEARGDRPAPAFGQGLDPAGAATPEGAVEALLEGAAELDLERIITLLPPDEMRVLYDYGPLFLDDVEEARQELIDEGFAMDVEDLALRVEGSGDQRTVAIEGGRLRAESDGDVVDVTIGGECTTIDITTTWPSLVGGEGAGGATEQVDTQHVELCGDQLTVDGEVTDVGDAPFGLVGEGAMAGLVVVERDGAWYVSPMRSMWEPLLAWLRSVERSDVEAMLDGLDDWTTGSTSFEGVGPTTVDPDDEALWEAEEACWQELPDPDTGVGPRDAFVRHRAMLVCLTDAGLDPSAVRDHDELWSEPCWAPYEALAPAADEAAWQAADAEVQACQIDRYGPTFVDGPRAVGASLLVPEGTGVAVDDPATGEVATTSPVCDWPSWLTPFPSGATTVEVLVCAEGLVGIDAGGTVVWERPDLTRGERNRVGPTAAATFDGSTVRVIDLSTGVDRWVLDGQADSNLAVTSTLVVTGSDEGLTAYDLATGTEVWSTRFATSGLWADEEAVYARSSTHVLRRLDPATGTVVWEADREPDKQSWSDVVAVTDHAVVLYATRTGRITAYDVATGAELWTRPHSTDGTALVAGDGRAVAIVNGDCRLDVLDDRTGEVVADAEDLQCYHPEVRAGTAYAVAWRPDGEVIAVLPLP